MTEAFDGRLVTGSFVRDILPTLSGRQVPSPEILRRLDRWALRCEEQLGPASSVRAIVDGAVLPLFDILGLGLLMRHDAPGLTRLHVAARTRPAAVVRVVPWGEPLGRAWRDTVLDAINADCRWGFCCNGRALRVIDARRTWTRDHLEFELARLGADEEARHLLWTLISGEALAGDRSLLDRAVDLSAAHGSDLCRSLGTGVLDALRLLATALDRKGRRRQAPVVVFGQSLTVLYRILFLLFAEARGLVPVWHPIYRDRYSVGSLVEALLAGRATRGLWHAIQAISRLAHVGCRAGDLRVTAFNGRLFSPAGSTTFDATRVEDGVMRDALLALGTTRPVGVGRRRPVAYRELDVEQLGAVYEQALEYEPAPQAAPALHADAAPLRRSRDRRKASGTFYTPRAVAASLVQRTLEPLVRGRSADAILQLRILDPAMGSGAFLVAACRYLASAVEEALLQEGRWHAADTTAADRAALRREVASRCLFGADLNPTAVQLARLSLWLASLAGDRPLSFLDHHLVAGDSLIGATPDDLARQPSRERGRRRAAAALPLFSGPDLQADLAHAARVRLALTLTPDDSAAVVQDKERVLERLQREDAVRRWKGVLDLWCAGWFWPEGAPPDRGTFHELCGALLHGRSSLPARTMAPLLAHAAATADRHRFLHWPLTFPEVFAASTDAPPSSGFDAIVGNPPWDMVRGDSGDDEQRERRRQDARQLTAFVRESGVYRVDGSGHANRYQLFLERALQLVRPGGRIGLVLPSGVVTDASTAALRRHLFDRADVDAIVGLDNRHGIFPIHRSVRFALLTCTTGTPTRAVACRFGVRRLDDLEPPPGAAAAPLVLTRQFLARLSGDDDLAIPELVTAADLRIVEQISAHCPWLGSPDGWHVRFGRELNATDDRALFVPRVPGGAGGWPVVEGKQIGPFRVALDACRLQLADGAADAQRFARRPRLAYRDVASATNRLTLIAAIVPARAVTTHTLFCLKTWRPLSEQHVLCALLNSFVANYLVRLRVTTHVTARLLARLPVPLVAAGHPAFARLDALARTLALAAEPPEGRPEYAELQALAARLYGLGERDVAYVLETFPLIDAAIRADVLVRVRRLT